MNKKNSLLLIILALAGLVLACSVQLTDPTPSPVSQLPSRTFTPDFPTFTAPPSLPSATWTIHPTITTTETSELPPTWTIHPTITTTFTPLAPTAEDCTPDSEYVSDLTIADGELFLPGETFTKTWRIRNDGTCTWTTDYQWVQVENSDAKLTASPDAVNLTSSVAPGETLDISVELTMSELATIGTLYEARFQMRAPDGTLFGTHPFTLVYASGGSGICPIPTAGTDAYVNSAAGYCFLYPDDFTVTEGGVAITVSGPPPAAGSEIVPHLSISSEPAAGLTSHQFANNKVVAWQAPGYPPDMGNIVLGGSDCWWAEGLPGATGNRIYFVVHNSRGFVMTLMPIDAAFSAMTADAEAMWDLVEGSFEWIEP